MSRRACEGQQGGRLKRKPRGGAAGRRAGGRGGRGGGGGAACAPPRSAASAPRSAGACGGGGGGRHLRQGCCPPGRPPSLRPASHPTAPTSFSQGPQPTREGRGGRGGGRQRARPPASHPRRAGAGRPSPAGRRRWGCGARWPPLPTSTPATCATSCRRGVSTAPSCNRHRHCRRRRCAAPARLPLGAR